MATSLGRRRGSGIGPESGVPAVTPSAEVSLGGGGGAVCEVALLPPFVPTSGGALLFGLGHAKPVLPGAALLATTLGAGAGGGGGGGGGGAAAIGGAAAGAGPAITGEGAAGMGAAGIGCIGGGGAAEALICGGGAAG